MTGGLHQLAPDARERLARFKREVEEALPGLVSRITLFGSRARGDAKEDSDYDVAVFVRDGADDRGVRSLVSDVAYPHKLDGIYISPVVLPADYLYNPAQAELAWEISKDGVIL